MTADEMQAFQDVQNQIVAQAVQAADRVILEQCQGSPEVLALLTISVAHAFTQKSLIMAHAGVLRMKMLCEVPPEILKIG